MSSISTPISRSQSPRPRRFPAIKFSPFYISFAPREIGRPVSARLQSPLGPVLFVVSFLLLVPMIPFFQEVLCFLFCEEKFLACKRAEELFPEGKD